MRFCLMVEGQEGIGWEQWIDLATACETNRLDGLFRSDHYLSLYQPNSRGSLDAWTTLAALGACTNRIRLGTLVSPVAFRHPSMLAKAVSSTDHVSNGRVEIGLGAGWFEREHKAYGFGFPSARVRFEMLAEQLEIVHGLFEQPQFSYHGRHYSLVDCPFLPKPIQEPHPPVIVGGKSGPRLIELVARFADEFNSNQGSPSECRERFARVRAGVERAGRDQESLTTSVMTGCIVGADEPDFRSRAERVAALMGTDGRSVAGFLDSVRPAWVLGTPDQAAEKLREFEAAGVQRVMLQHHLNDVETVELLAEEVFPRVC